jgi:DNA-binding beta-propeller fold protein YncE
MIVTNLQTGVNPSGLAFTDNGEYIYVANNNSYVVEGEDSISVIDIKKNKIINQIHDKSFTQPYTITINSSLQKAYVTNAASTQITIININTNNVIGTIDGFNGPSDMVIGKDFRFGYVSNYGLNNLGNTVNCVDLINNKIISTIKVDTAPNKLALSRNCDILYCLNYVDGNFNTGTINVIELKKFKIINTIKGFFGPFDIKLHPKKNIAYVSNFGSNNFNPIGKEVSIVDLNKNIILKNIKVGIQPAGMVISRNSNYLFVANYNTLYQYQQDTNNATSGTGIISIIDTNTNKLLDKNIVVGLGPSNISISPNGKCLAISNYVSNTVNLLHCKKNRRLKCAKV